MPASVHACHLFCHHFTIGVGTPCYLTRIPRLERDGTQRAEWTLTLVWPVSIHPSFNTPKQLLKIQIKNKAMQHNAINLYSAEVSNFGDRSTGFWATVLLFHCLSSMANRMLWARKGICVLRQTAWWQLLLQRVSIACYAERCISYDIYSVWSTVRPSDRLTVYLSHAGIMPKRLQLRSCGLHWRIAPWL